MAAIDTIQQEARSHKMMLGIVREIADSLAHDSTQITETVTGRDDMEGYEIENPVTPGIVTCKRGVSADKWGYEWNRIHVTVGAASIGTSGIMKIKNRHNLEVVDVWQDHEDEEREMGQEGRPGITFALEPR